MCETRDLGVKSPQWYTLMFDGQGRVDMGSERLTPFFRRIVVMERSPSGRRGGHLMELGRRPRERRD